MANDISKNIYQIFLDKKYNSNESDFKDWLLSLDSNSLDFINEQIEYYHFKRYDDQQDIENKYIKYRDYINYALYNTQKYINFDEYVKQFHCNLSTISHGKINSTIFNRDELLKFYRDKNKYSHRITKEIFTDYPNDDIKSIIKYIKSNNIKINKKTWIKLHHFTNNQPITFNMIKLIAKSDYYDYSTKKDLKFINWLSKTGGNEMIIFCKNILSKKFGY